MISSSYSDEYKLWHSTLIGLPQLLSTKVFSHLSSGMVTCHPYLPVSSTRHTNLGDSHYIWIQKFINSTYLSSLFSYSSSAWYSGSSSISSSSMLSLILIRCRFFSFSNLNAYWSSINDCDKPSSLTRLASYTSSSNSSSSMRNSVSTFQLIFSSHTTSLLNDSNSFSTSMLWSVICYNIDLYSSSRLLAFSSKFSISLLMSHMRFYILCASTSEHTSSDELLR